MKQLKRLPLLFTLILSMTILIFAPSCTKEGLIGERGPQGEQGDRGEQGVRGATGPQGERGATGSAGATVTQRIRLP